MFYQDEIKKMISELGATNIDIVSNWNPSIQKEDLVRMIKDSDELELVNGIVSLKEKKISYNDDITYENLMTLIENYNNKTKYDFEHYDVDALKINSIKKYLIEKRHYKLEEYDSNDNFICYLIEDRNDLVIVICKNYTEELDAKLSNDFKDQEAKIYYIKKTYESKNYDFGFYNVESIIEETIKKRQLDIKKVDIYKIVEE